MCFLFSYDMDISNNTHLFGVNVQKGNEIQGVSCKYKTTE